MNSVEKSEVRTVPWKTSDVAKGTALVVGGIFVVFVVVVIYEAVAADPESGWGLVILAGAFSGWLILAAWFVGPARYGASLGSLGLRLAVPRSYGRVVLPVLALAASLTFTGLYAGLMSVLGWDVSHDPLEEIDLEGPAVIGALAVVAILWGPLAEELFFRGFVFPGLIGSIGVVRAAVASSLLFSLFHLDPRVIVPFFVTGLLLAYLYHRTGSLWSSFAAHAMQNALAFSISVWV